ncbi:MAG: SMI1/KNR4 family protein [Planctomycetia bacterium]|nr:SMI1/KNR4 family protein [Planctomycetia bacterium]
MATYESVSARLRAATNVRRGAGATEGDLASIERELGVQILGGYLRFLLQFGFASMASLEIYGVGGPKFLDVVVMTKSERQEMASSMPIDLIPFCADGGGDHHCIRCDGSPEPVVVFWSHDARPEDAVDFEAPSFAEWLNEKLDALRVDEK